MRILFVADERAIHMQHWARALRRLGHVVGYVAFGEQPWMVDLDSRYRLRWPFSGYLRYVLAIRQVKQAITDFDPEVVHAYYLTNYGLLAALSTEKPLVVTVAGSDLFVESRRSALFRLANRYVLRRASIVHLVAEHMVPSALKAGAQRKKIRVIHEGVDLRIFRPFEDSIESRPPVVICTRQFRPVHDVSTVVTAMVELVAKRDDLSGKLRFVFLGNGPERRKLEELAHGKVGDVAEFLGARSWEGVASQLRRAAVYVSPSRSDGTSVSLLQAMISGAFPVVTDIPANREWIQDGVNGLLFPPGDPYVLASKITQAMHDVSLRVRAARLNKKLILERGGDELMVGKVEEMYRDAVRK